jgi:hypothetical protein
LKVATCEGEVDREELEVRDLVSEDDNARVIATEWRREGRLVRRDVFVNMLRGVAVGVKSGL